MRLRAGKMLIVAGAISLIGPAAGQARGSFLVQVTATLNAPTNGSVTTNQSTTALSSFTGSPADVDAASAGFPVHETFGSTIVSSGNSTGVDHVAFPYSWTLSFAHMVNGQMVGTGATATVTGSIGGLVSVTGSTIQNVYNGLSTGTTTVGPGSSLPISVDGRPLLITLDAWSPPGTPPIATQNFSVGLMYAPGSGFPIPAGGGDGGGGGGGGPTPVPEPGTIALLGLGAAILAAGLRRRTGRTVAVVG